MPTRGAAPSIHVTAPRLPCQLAVSAKKLFPKFTDCRPALPTRSPATSPTRLLAADTTPVIPVVGSAQVIAPASACPALLQCGLRIAILDPTTVVPLLPMRSLAVAPTRLLAEETVPETPVVVLKVVSAPALLFQVGLPSRMLPPPSVRTMLPLPTWSPAWLPRRLEINAPLVPLYRYTAPESAPAKSSR